jgi:putative nucleotidyltransferase with HDIG domain/PAS domain S-box-containing protein
MSIDSNHSILEGLMEGCQIIDKEYRYCYVNNAAARHGRKPKEELLDHVMMEVYPGIESTFMFSMLRKCMEERTPVEIENEFFYQDGSSAWFALKMDPIPEGVFVFSIDITPRKKTEIDLQNQLQRLKALREIDIAIVGTTNLTLALRTIQDQLISTLSLDAVAILLLNKNTNNMEFASGRGFRTKGIEKSQIRLGQGHAGKAALEQVTIFTPDLRNPQEPFLRADLIKNEDFISYIAVPLVTKGNLIGVLEVFHRSLLHPDDDWLDFLDALAGQASIAIENAHLFHDLNRSNLNLMLAYDNTLEGWSKALDLRDKETEGHTLRVTTLTIDLAKKAGMLENEIMHVRRGALLHDIGKMGVPDSILLKPGKLTEEEWVVMRKHPVFAYELLYPIEFLRPAIAIPHEHHERWDGTGYPRGLEGKQISLEARLFALVDVWDALLHDRPYRKAWQREKVIQYIHEQSGTQFDPKAVNLFLQLIE